MKSVKFGLTEKETFTYNLVLAQKYIKLVSMNEYNCFTFWVKIGIANYINIGGYILEIIRIRTSKENKTSPNFRTILRYNRDWSMKRMKKVSISSKAS